MTIAQVRVPDSTNEITQADSLLDAVRIPEGEPVLVTLDAAHTQRETAESVAGKPGLDYLMTVKGNQLSLQRAVFDETLPLLTEAPHHAMEEHDRGRIKRRSCWITGAEGIDFRTPARPPLSAVRYSRYPATASARNTNSSSPAGKQKGCPLPT